MRSGASLDKKLSAWWEAVIDTGAGFWSSYSTNHLLVINVMFVDPSFISTSCLFLNKPSNCKEQAKFVVLLEFYLYECSLLWLSNILFLLQIPPLFLDVLPHHKVLDSKIHPNLISYLQSKVCALKLHPNKDCAYWCFCWIQCIHLTMEVWGVGCEQCVQLLVPRPSNC